MLFFCDHNAEGRARSAVASDDERRQRQHATRMAFQHPATGLLRRVGSDSAPVDLALHPRATDPYMWH